MSRSSFGYTTQIGTRVTTYAQQTHAVQTHAIQTHAMHTGFVNVAPGVSGSPWPMEFEDLLGDPFQRPRAGIASMPAEKCGYCMTGTVTTVSCNPTAAWCQQRGAGHAHKRCMACGEFVVPEDVKSVYRNAGLEVPARI